MYLFFSEDWLMSFLLSPSQTTTYRIQDCTQVRMMLHHLSRAPQRTRRTCPDLVKQLGIWTGLGVRLGRLVTGLCGRRSSKSGICILKNLARVCCYNRTVILLADIHRDLTQGTLDLPKWIPGNWSGTWPRLFSFQPQLDGPPPESDPPPKKHGKEILKRERDEKSESKESNDRPQHTPSKEHSQFASDHTQPLPVDIIHQLLTNPILYDPLRTPRFPIVLCHGESISPSQPIREAALLNLSITQVYMASIPEVQPPSQV